MPWRRSRSTGFFLALFLCVLLHEFGHILMARRFGIRTPDVILLPIGGRGPAGADSGGAQAGAPDRAGGAGRHPGDRTRALGGAPLAGDPAAGPGPHRDRGAEPAGKRCSRSTSCCCFNLIPAFPMDGGRVLRALLAVRLGIVRATRHRREHRARGSPWWPGSTASSPGADPDPDRGVRLLRSGAGSGDGGDPRRGPGHHRRPDDDHPVRDHPGLRHPPAGGGPAARRGAAGVSGGGQQRGAWRGC